MNMRSISQVAEMVGLRRASMGLNADNQTDEKIARAMTAYFIEDETSGIWNSEHYSSLVLKLLADAEAANLDDPYNINEQADNGAELILDETLLDDFINRIIDQILVRETPINIILDAALAADSFVPLNTLPEPRTVVRAASGIRFFDQYPQPRVEEIAVHGAGRPLDALPQDVWNYLSSFLSIPDMVHLSMIDRRRYQALQTPAIWHIKLKQRFPLYQEYDDSRHPATTYRMLCTNAASPELGSEVMKVTQLQACLASEEKFKANPRALILKILNAVHAHLITTTRPQILLLLNSECYRRNLQSYSGLIYSIMLYHCSPDVLHWAAVMDNTLSDNEREGVNFMLLSRAEQQRTVDEIAVSELPCTEELFLAMAATRHLYVEAAFDDYADTLSTYALDMLCMLNPAIAAKILQSEHVVRLSKEKLLAYMIFQYARYRQGQLKHNIISCLLSEHLVNIAAVSEDFGKSVLNSECNLMLGSSSLAMMCLEKEKYAESILSNDGFVSRLQACDVVDICLKNIRLGMIILKNPVLYAKLSGAHLTDLIKHDRRYAEYILNGDLSAVLSSHDILTAALCHSSYANLILRSPLVQRMEQYDLLALAKSRFEYTRIILQLPVLKKRIEESLVDLLVIHEDLYWLLGETAQQSRLKAHEWRRVIREKPAYLIYELLGLSHHLDADDLSSLTRHHEHFIKTHLRGAAVNLDAVMVNDDMLVTLCLINKNLRDYILAEPVLFSLIHPDKHCIVLDDELNRQFKSGF